MASGLHQPLSSNLNFPSYYPLRIKTRTKIFFEPKRVAGGVGFSDLGEIWVKYGLCRVALFHFAFILLWFSFSNWLKLVEAGGGYCITLMHRFCPNYQKRNSTNSPPLSIKMFRFKQSGAESVGEASFSGAPRAPWQTDIHPAFSY